MKEIKIIRIDDKYVYIKNTNVYTEHLGQYTYIILND
jgi:hypothetical protein